MKLLLGVVDLPYGKAPKAKKRKGRASKSAPALTTGDVAEILEAKYHPLRIFFELKQKKVAKSLEGSLAGALESLMMGAPPSLAPFGTATDEITGMMKQFIAKGEMERLGYPGVPTKAALDGVNHRLTHPYSKDNPRRPSFIDTGQYQADLKAWIE